MQQSAAETDLANKLQQTVQKVCDASKRPLKPKRWKNSSIRHVWQGDWRGENSCNTCSKAGFIYSEWCFSLNLFSLLILPSTMLNAHNKYKRHSIHLMVSMWENNWFAYGSPNSSYTNRFPYMTVSVLYTSAVVSANPRGINSTTGETGWEKITY